MAGILSSLMLTGLLSAAPVGFTFDGPEATARTVGGVGYFTQGPLPFTDLFERGTGSAELSVQDRIADPRATYGDSARLVATFDIAGNSYRVELDRAGFPPGPIGAPAQPIAGGVVLNQEIHGGAPLGSPRMPRERAAVALWGVGRVWRNGELLTDSAVIHAAALAWGAHADDDTFRVLPVARQGDTELDVVVWNLPRELEPRGFIQFDFDDVAITVNGVDVPAVAVVPTTGVYAGVAPPSSAVPGGTSLGSVPNTSPQQQGVGGAGLAGTTVPSQFGQGQSQFGQGLGQFGTAAVTGTQQSNAPPTLGATDGLADAARTEQLAPQADVTLPSVASQQGGVIEPFLEPGRVSLSTQNASQPDVVTPGSTTTPVVPDTFVTPTIPGRVALNANEPGPPNQPNAEVPSQTSTPFVPDAFENPARVRISSQLPTTTTTGGFVPLTSTQSPFLSTNGSFSVVPLVPGVPGPEFAFGGTRVTAGVVSTPSTSQVQTPAVPLVSTPQPLNSQQPVPLVASPLPISGQSAVPLISTPPPLNSQPVAATPPGATPPTANPGASTVPGVVPTPATTTAPGATVPPGAVPTTAPSGGAAPSP